VEGLKCRLTLKHKKALGIWDKELSYIPSQIFVSPLILAATVARELSTKRPAAHTSHASQSLASERVEGIDLRSRYLGRMGKSQGRERSGQLGDLSRSILQTPAHVLNLIDNISICICTPDLSPALQQGF
jgi:hypothetical protein